MRGSFSSRTRRLSASTAAAISIELLEDRTLLSSLTVDGGYDPSSILVRFHEEFAFDDAAPTDAGTTAAPYVGSTATPLFDRSVGAAANLWQIELPAGVTVEEALAAFQADTRVAYAEPNYEITLSATVNDPRFEELWGLNNTGQTGGTADADIDAIEAWDIHTGSGGTLVAVIDTGVDYTHEDLAVNMWVNPGEIAGDGLDNDGNGYIDDVHGYDFANNDGDPMDDQGHGTHVAGTIGAVGNNGIGVAGVNWGVQLMALKFIGADGTGSIADAIEAINYAVAHGAKISNNSWGFGGEFSQALYDAIVAAGEADHVFVAAAGNGNFLGIGQDNDATPFWPSSFDLDNIVSVAALDHNDNIATFSNYGATSVDLGAPGVDILSTRPGDAYGLLSGTSMAAPHVTGAIALMRDLNPEWSYQQVIARVLETVDPVADLQGVTVTGGRLNAAAALAPVTTAPWVVSADPSGRLSGEVDHVRLLFSEPIDVSTFTVDDVTLTGPSGSIAVTGVAAVPETGDTQFDVTFAVQSDFGDYTLVLGVDVADLDGELLDQDRDTVAGEPVEDRFTSTFTLERFHRSFDFGTESSPVGTGYIQITDAELYAPAIGYGWTGGAVQVINRGAGTDLTRDLAYAGTLDFAVDAPDGIYEVTVTLGDTDRYAHDLMEVYLEGRLFQTVTTEAFEVKTITYTVEVADGQLNLQILDAGGSDPNAVINALEVVFAGDDTQGPRVVGVDPAGAVTGTVNDIVVTFSETLAEGTFTLADVVSLTGPQGEITPAAVNRIDSFTFEITFADQNHVGEYTMTIGPDIADVAGNLMDQDQDGTGGEATDDRFTSSFTLEPFAAAFDFGTSTSPVASGYTGIDPADAYSAAAGYGWVDSSVLSTSRSTGTDLTRDLVYAPSMEFVVDVPDGFYDVTLTIGDTDRYPHDEMGVFLEGTHLDTVSTAAHEVVTVTYLLEVTDGRVNLVLTDLGGADANAVLNGLEVRWDSGPRVVAAEPDGYRLDPVSSVTLTFSEPVLEGSFTVEDIVSFTGPPGSITPTDVVRLDAARYEVLFAEQSDVGIYTMLLGPAIHDLRGNAMDQDGDSISGEEPDDLFSTSFQIVPVLEKYDSGTATSPVADGYTPVYGSSTYSAEAGFGWLDGGESAVDRGTLDSLTRDLAYGSSLTFGVDVPDGVYEVTLTLGDTSFYAHDDMGVFLEGVQFGTVSTAAYEMKSVTFEVSVSDGQLTVKLTDLGGSDPNAVLSGLELVWIAPDTFGPMVVEAAPQGRVDDPVDRVILTFNEPVLEGTFTLDDVAGFTGPDGPIAPAAVNRLDPIRYEVVFAVQSATGEYSLVVGPEISDAFGHLMNQDGDDVNGEALEDRFEARFEIVPFIENFDFGTSSSPVEAGYVQVDPGDAYSSETGYGFTAAAPNAANRSSGTSLTRDLVWAPTLDFAVDLPAGVYDVTLILGDTGPYPHDQIEVVIEGVPIDVVGTAAGEVKTITHSVTVGDGRFDLHMQDLGGSDANVVLNGLELVWTGEDTFGPSVVSAAPEGSVTGTVDAVALAFSEAIDAASFTTADVSLTGPDGEVNVIAVNQLDATHYEIVFDPVSALGDYTLIVGPDITDLSGNVMDQDGDGTGGESPDDRFDSTFRIVAFLGKYDFGTSNSPVEAGWTQVDPDDAYSSAAGFGFTGTAPLAVSRSSGSNLERDLVYRNEINFAVDVPDGLYDVTLTIGDTGSYAHDQMALFLEGTQLDTIDTAAFEIKTLTWQVEVSDGQLNLRLADQGGSDANAVLNGLEVAWAGDLPAGQTAAVGSRDTSQGSRVEGQEPERARRPAVWPSNLDSRPLTLNRQRTTDNGQQSSIVHRQSSMLRGRPAESDLPAWTSRTDETDPADHDDAATEPPPAEIADALFQSAEFLDDLLDGDLTRPIAANRR